MFPLSSDDGRALLNIARQAISSAVIEKCLPDFPPHPAALSVHAGAFVTLHCQGRLRGCVGQVGNTEPVADAVARAAINAALHDSRFSPVAIEEIATLEIEVSVLSPPQPIAPEQILPGRHGIIVVSHERRGLLLPQVAAGRQWTCERLLEETCIKAGLSPDAWQNPLTQIFGFTAEIFSEAGDHAVSGF
jgi:AmmeMemoRadiSam system protein A